ncbi:MAG: hypothetical protein KGJ86_20730 [Chloroflexota bacterium]|nr:hypothetical protein [Chloroflexota bacterium]
MKPTFILILLSARFPSRICIKSAGGEATTGGVELNILLIAMAITAGLLGGRAYSIDRAIGLNEGKR